MLGALRCSNPMLNLRPGVYELLGAQILAYVNRVRDVDCQVDNEAFTLADVEANDVRCPDQEAAKAMYKGAPPSTPLCVSSPVAFHVC